MTPLENNATVVGLTKLPDCLFMIEIRPDWNTDSIPWSPGQFVRIGILDDDHNHKDSDADTNRSAIALIGGHSTFIVGTQKNGSASSVVMERNTATFFCAEG